MWWFLGFLVVAFVVYRLRVPIMARVLGQSESRINRQITRKKDR
jgi:hypothetical protein